jgi:flavorubredoxin
MAQGHILFDNGTHVCLMYSDLVPDEQGEAVQANQFLVIDHGHAALIDPGGAMTYNELFVSIGRYVPPKQLDLLLASHADPDIVASVGRWLTGSTCQLHVSRLWSRFVPHFAGAGKTQGRIVPIADAGARITLGKSTLVAVPAHFLHSEGNFQFYDPVSKILFSGDLGASLVNGTDAALPVDDFERHVRDMEGFHKRYMISRKIARLWANMARGMDIEAIVPQHGRRFVGKPMVRHFIDWIETVDCGIDLMTQDHYRLPA